jgi:uncharacterized membrane protein (DUF2068 family)
MIIGYKLLKSAAELLAGASVLLLPTGEMMDVIHALARDLSDLVAAAWSHALAGVLVRVTTPRHLDLIAAALVMDGLSSALEGWSLHGRYRWGRWLVVVATSALLPLEIVELARRLTVFRIALLLANVAIVLYLLRQRITRAPTATHDG